MAEVKNTLLKVRTAHHMTQEALAQAVHVSRQTIIAIEKGNYTPSVLLALKLAKHFKCRVEDLFLLRK